MEPLAALQPDRVPSRAQRRRDLQGPRLPQRDAYRGGRRCRPDGPLTPRLGCRRLPGDREVHAPGHRRGPRRQDTREPGKQLEEPPDDVALDAAAEALRGSAAGGLPLATPNGPTGGARSGRWPSPPGSLAMSTWSLTDHSPRLYGRARTHRGTPARPTRRRGRRWTTSSRRFGSSPALRWTSSRMARSTRSSSCWPNWMSSWPACARNAAAAMGPVQTGVADGDFLQRLRAVGGEARRDDVDITQLRPLRRETAPDLRPGGRTSRWHGRSRTRYAKNCCG